MEQQTYNWYATQVEFHVETEKANGDIKIKKQKEMYLIYAHSCTEAEATIVQNLSHPNIEFEVTAVKQTKYIDVLTEDNVKDLAKKKED
jgi:hypothetical protein